MLVLRVDRVVLEKLLHKAAAASRLIGHIDHEVVVGPLADDVDEIVHVLTELLGHPEAFAAEVPNASATFPAELAHLPEPAPLARPSTAQDYWLPFGRADRSTRSRRHGVAATVGAVRSTRVARSTMLVALLLLAVAVAAAMGGAP
jgi:hypothetical protein